MEMVPLSSEQRLIRIRNYIDKMPSLSTTVTKVLEICNLPNPLPNDLNRVISLDPVLTGQVLRLINSAYYSLPNQITSLTRAIIMLGINTVKNLALSTAVLGYLGKTHSLQCLPIDQFWKHSICVGVTAKALAAHKGIDPGLREEFFVAGLLHDLGKVPLSNRSPEEYKQAIALADLEQGALRQAEMTTLGLDHGAVGRLIAEKWQLSDPLRDTLQFHHDPAAAPAGNRRVVILVALANIYANLYDIGSAGDAFPQPRKIALALKMAKMTWPEIQGLHDTVHSEVEKAQVFLQISKEA
ncbi:MAG: HDOD domain-containing protein [Desulfobacteraceae bacterium]|nr:HDOD domain-containing protein [Desulfobacteraceae bacterium]